MENKAALYASSDIMGLLTIGLLWDVWKYNTQWFEAVQLHLFNNTSEWQHFSPQLRLDFFHLCINMLYLIFTWTAQITWGTSFCFNIHDITIFSRVPLLLPVLRLQKGHGASATLFCRQPLPMDNDLAGPHKDNSFHATQTVRINAELWYYHTRLTRPT